MNDPGSASPEVSAESAYVGLTHYTERDADRFFGRDAECALIIGNLRAARLTLLYAESGVGKSSVLRAGVTARLRVLAERDARERGAPRFIPVVFSAWSDEPVRSLIDAIAAAVEPFVGADVEFARHDLRAALDTAADATGATVLVILDQFEEYLMYRSRDEGELADQVATCVNDATLRANFLISIRQDAYAGLGDLFRGQIANVYGNFLHLEHLTVHEAREAIEKPIERINELHSGAEPYAIEPRLVEAVLDSDEIRRAAVMGSENGAAGGGGDRPDQVEATNLQLVMQRLWEEETGAGSRTLRLETLERLGGAEAIIGTHLDRSMSTLHPNEQSAAAAAFRFLVTREGTKIALTAATLAEHSGREESQLEPVLRRLSAGDLHILRPVSTRDGDANVSYEIFHDALARPIADWRARREKAELAERLEREREAKDEARRDAAAAERREATEKRRKRIALVALGVAIAALVGGAVAFAIIQSNLAASRKKASQSIESAERISELSGTVAFGPGAAALAGTEAYSLSPTFEARNQVLAALQQNAGLPRVAAGQTREVQGVAFFPGAPIVASAAADGTIRLLNLRGGQIGRPLVRPHHAYVSYDATAVTPPLGDSRRRILASHADGFVGLWDVTNPRNPHYLSSITASKGYGAVAFDPANPHLLALTEPDGDIGLWSVRDAREPHRIGHSVSGPGHVYGIAFSGSGGVLAAAGAAGERAWSVSGSRLGGRANPPLSSTDGGDAIAIAPNGSWAYGLASGAIRVYDARRDRTRVLQTAGAVYSVAFAGHGGILVSGGNNHTVTTWDVRTGLPIGPLRTHGGTVESVAASSNGRLIASGGDDHLVKIWPLPAKRALATTVGAFRANQGGDKNYPAWINDISISSDGSVAGAAYRAGAFIWRVASHQSTSAEPSPATHIKPPAHQRTSAVAYHDEVLAVASGRSFRLWNTGPSCSSMPDHACALGQPTRTFGSAQVGTVAFNASGKLLASAGGGGHLNLWEVSDPSKIRHLWGSPEVAGRIEQVAFSPVSPLLAVATSTGSVQVWDIDEPRNPARVGSPLQFGQDVRGLAFSPNGRLLASGGADEQVTLSAVHWNPASRTGSISSLQTFPQSDTIDSVAFSPDGTTLAAADASGRNCVYDVASRRLIGGSSCLSGYGMPGFSNRTMSIEFTPDGQRLLTAGSGNPVIAWDSVLWSQADDESTVDALRTDACAIASGNLTARQWEQVFAGTDLASNRARTCSSLPP